MYERTPDLVSVRKSMDNFSQSLQFIGTGTGAYRTPKASQPRITSGGFEGLSLFDKRPLGATSPIARQAPLHSQIVEIPVIREVPASYVHRQEHHPAPVRYVMQDEYQPVEVESFEVQPPIVVSGRRQHRKKNADRKSVQLRPAHTVTYQSMPWFSQTVDSNGDHINGLLFSKNGALRLSHHTRHRPSFNVVNSMRASLPAENPKHPAPHDMFLPEDVKMLYLNPEMIKKDFKDKVDLDCDQVNSLNQDRQVH